MSNLCKCAIGTLWSVAGLAFTISVVIALMDAQDGQISDYALSVHGAVRFTCLVLALAGCTIWLLAEIRRMRIVQVPVRREPVYVGAARVTGLPAARTDRLPEPARRDDDKRLTDEQRKARAEAYVDRISDDTNVVPFSRDRHNES